MSMTITLPDELALALGATQAERQQRAREAIALDLYREGRISLRVMGRLAGAGDDYWAADAFRSLHGLPVNYGDAEAVSDEGAADRGMRMGADE